MFLFWSYIFSVFGAGLKLELLGGQGWLCGWYRRGRVLQRLCVHRCEIYVEWAILVSFYGPSQIFDKGSLLPYALFWCQNYFKLKYQILRWSGDEELLGGYAGGIKDDRCQFCKYAGVGNQGDIAVLVRCMAKLPECVWDSGLDPYRYNRSWPMGFQRKYRFRQSQGASAHKGVSCDRLIRLLIQMRCRDGVGSGGIFLPGILSLFYWIYLLQGMPFYWVLVLMRIH